MLNKDDPWAKMPPGSERRIGETTGRNLFWMTDLRGDYGFCIRVEWPFDDVTPAVNLKGISILKRNREGGGELFLVLAKKEDWQIFEILCSDLISVALRSDSDKKMVGFVEVRLKRWQQLLRQDRLQELTTEIQMGLFSELLCLRDLISPRIGIRQSIISWVGPQSDKQDFLTDGSAVEVKSYRTSKGPIITISSIQQLSSEKESLFLISYGLTRSENGLTVGDISHTIRELLNEYPSEIGDLFDSKLTEYGYVPELIKEPLIQFIADMNRIYLVTESFPRIETGNIPRQIVSVKYAIDLSKCKEFEIDKSAIVL